MLHSGAPPLEMSQISFSPLKRYWFPTESTNWEVDGSTERRSAQPKLSKVARRTFNIINFDDLKIVMDWSALDKSATPKHVVLPSRKPPLRHTAR